MGSRTRRERSTSKSCAMERRTPLALLETHGRLITEATYFPSLLEGCAAQTLSASGLQAPVSNVRFGSKPAAARLRLATRRGFAATANAFVLQFENTAQA